MGQSPDQLRADIAATRERMNDTVDALGYKADVKSRLNDAVTERISTVKQSIGGVMSSVRDSVTGAAQNVSSAAQQAAGDSTALPGELSQRAQSAASSVAENPLGLALGGLAIGIVAGLLVPVSDIERKQLGPLRDRLVDRAQSTIGDVVEQGKAVVAETLGAARDSAQQHASSVIATATGQQNHTDASAKDSQAKPTPVAVGQ